MDSCDDDSRLMTWLVKIGSRLCISMSDVAIGVAKPPSPIAMEAILPMLEETQLDPDFGTPTFRKYF
jgi:hypothetical protein